ncbi:MAG: GtrA family protein [Actinomycetota bacterium]|nr:GtrA family protein [Actinomycetota bacterium]
MDISPSALLERSRTPGGKKMVRYTLVSVISVMVSLVVLFVALYFFHWSARTANIVAVGVSAIPSYALNRAWAWGKTGRSHLFKEVVPFWAMAFLGLVISTWAAVFTKANAHYITTSRLGVTLLVMASNIASFGLLWFGKFMILNKVLFAHRPAEIHS